MFLFDTDHVVIAQQKTLPEFDHLIRRVQEQNPLDLFVSVISFHEQVMGWNACISNANVPSGVVRGYDRLQRLIANFAEAQVLAFDDAASEVFHDLRSQRVRIGTMDLRIASIAIAQGMTVLTRNIGADSEHWVL